MAVTFGIDVSHHQGGTLDFAAMRREGVEFAFLKATEGGTLQDSEFARNLARARAAGLLVAAYHYVRSDTSVAAQAANVTRTVPKGVPVIPDVENASGGVAGVRALVDALRRSGYHVPLTYIPRWYWQQIGSPSLIGLPSLWSSRYPDNNAGTIHEEYDDVPAAYWVGYGGLGVTVLQFTSSARVAGRSPLDANAYLGTRDQLAALLYPSTTAPEKKEDLPVKNLILAQEADGKGVWVGDGVTRRHVADTNELDGLQYWIGQKGGDATIHASWVDLRVLGTDVSALLEKPTPAPVNIDYDKFVSDVVSQLAARLGTLRFDAEPNQ